MGRLPRSLLLALVVLSVVSFAVSLYLEMTQLAFLQAHPIMVNLISGVVGFSTAAVVVGAVFNWYTARDHAIRNSRTIKWAALNMLALWSQVKGHDIRSAEGFEIARSSLRAAGYSNDTAERLVREFREWRGDQARPVNDSRDMKLLKAQVLVHERVPELNAILGDDSLAIRQRRSKADRYLQLAESNSRRKDDFLRYLNRAVYEIHHLIEESLEHPIAKRALEGG